MFFYLLLECASEDALGLESGLVTNQQMSASSSLDKDHGPENARLNLAAIRGKTGAWAAKTNDQNQFLQVDFGEMSRLQNCKPKATMIARGGYRSTLFSTVRIKVPLLSLSAHMKKKVLIR